MLLIVRRAPDHVMGLISRFLSEIDPGVFAGVVSRRVADALWSRLCESESSDEVRAIRLLPSDSEQGFELVSINPTRKPVDLDGFLVFDT